MRGVTKRYPGVIACDAIDLDVRQGEIHALLGENGAGKSTLMNVLYGLATPDEGQILVDGTPVHIGEPSDAIDLGISMVHQHFMLVPVLSVADNRRERELIVNVLERYGGWPNQARNIGESLTVRGLWQSAKKAGIVDCSGSGLGCVLIKREVLEAVDFREPKDPGFCDMDWTERVYRMGFRMRADCNLVCGHKDVDGEVLWPR